jgi:hypothetical protein
MVFFFFYVILFLFFLFFRYKGATCENRPFPIDFFCVCQNGYFGRFCEKPSTTSFITTTKAIVLPKCPSADFTTVEGTSYNS